MYSAKSRSGNKCNWTIAEENGFFRVQWELKMKSGKTFQGFSELFASIEDAQEYISVEKKFFMDSGIRIK